MAKKQPPEPKEYPSIDSVFSFLHETEENYSTPKSRGYGGDYGAMQKPLNRRIEALEKQYEKRQKELLKTDIHLGAYKSEQADLEKEMNDNQEFIKKRIAAITRALKTQGLTGEVKKMVDSFKKELDELEKDS